MIVIVIDNTKSLFFRIKGKVFLYSNVGPEHQEVFYRAKRFNKFFKDKTIMFSLQVKPIKPSMSFLFFFNGSENGES